MPLVQIDDQCTYAPTSQGPLVGRATPFLSWARGASMPVARPVRFAPKPIPWEPGSKCPLLSALICDAGTSNEFSSQRHAACQGCRSPIDEFCHLKLDRKSTRLNSSHLVISYAVFCLK